MLRSAPRIAVLAVQFVCAGYFSADIAFSVLGINVVPISWQYREYLEIGAALGLIGGVVLGARQLAASVRAQRETSEKLRRASSDFMAVVEERFAEWSLSRAERDVALFAVKGLSTAEIAALRGTSEGTVKAQTAAVYRKAGVTGRPQLLSLFIEDLFDPPAPAASATPAPLAPGPRPLAADDS